jgi:hypothetical protein
MTPRPDCDDSPLDRRKFESKLQGAWSLVKNKIDILNTADSVFDSAAIIDKTQNETAFHFGTCPAHHVLDDLLIYLLVRND